MTSVSPVNVTTGLSFSAVSSEVSTTRFSIFPPEMLTLSASSVTVRVSITGASLSASFLASTVVSFAETIISSTFVSLSLRTIRIPSLLI